MRKGNDMGECSICIYFMPSGNVFQGDRLPEGKEDSEYGFCHLNPPIHFGDNYWGRPIVFEDDRSCSHYVEFESYEN